MSYFANLDGTDDGFNNYNGNYNGGSSQLSSLPNYGAPVYDASIPPGPPAPPAVQQMQEPGYAQPSASAMALAQQPAPQPTYNAPQPRSAMYAAPSFWDRLAGKRVEVAKMIVLSLVVLLAISLDRMSSHYLTGYIGTAFLTTSQEFLVRLSYPLIVLLCLWMLKAL